MKRTRASLSKLRQKLPPGCPAIPAAAEPMALVEGVLSDQSLLLRAAFARAIKRSTKKRWAIAAEISMLISRDVTAAMLDKYCAESATAHRMPADILAAFCLVTGDYGAAEVVMRPCGRVLLPRMTRLAEAGTPCDTLMRDLAALMAEMGQAAEEAGRAMADHKLEAVERDRLVREFLDLADQAMQACAHLTRQKPTP